MTGVTGAAGGIGRGVALQLASRGCQLVLGDVSSPEAGDKVVAHIWATAEKRGVPPVRVRVRFVRVEISNETEVEAFVAAGVAEFGRIDGLAHCASINPLRKI
ncbi:hypothetical protein B0A53_04820 [Rhodotorula sp. CCFEE 5036]|nr:hypothetical protein B0A53_04820 [Rhodotorula sp. CCFEE 5036]